MKKYAIPAFAAALLATASPAVYAQESEDVVSMQAAIDAAMRSNPEILQAQYNKEGIQFERKQAQGLYGPRVDFEASAGIRRLENTTRRNLGIANNELYPIEAGITGEWTVIDFGRRRGELLRQAARVDGASLRVLERSEFIALQVSRQYLDVLLQQRVQAAATDNRRFHELLVGDLSQGVSQGSISIADQQQAEERLQAAIVREEEARRAFNDAQITLRALTGLDIFAGNMPPDLMAQMPGSLEMAIGQSRTRNPLVREAQADVDAANALVKAAEADIYPTIGLEVRGRIGEDIDGFAGETNDVQGRVVLRWNVFDSGIRKARVQEEIRKASMARYALHQRQREAEQDVRSAWNALETQGRVVGALERQSNVSDDLLLSYRSQFNIGRRSLLDVLDAQNTRFNTQVRLETARFSEMFARYQILAATNTFLDALGMTPGTGAGEDERGRFEYGPPVEAETQRRVYPK
ncbi:TolC family protein [Erythrobacter sp. THAF29]|uniref:TolC family protein n=1 Tax=Erythrobacter sp. THAF29 TaxID=2587851 RepID=UPI0012A91190|nr:TolC family protein [Erythrobacter sp. THAF29]QFT76809.1 Outer membrane efflux protein BepC precursor [Erythrobacter sp. THAF29]